MSMPKRLYEIGRDIAMCELVKTRKPTPENMVAMQNLLNISYPKDEVESAQFDLVRRMYLSNPIGFLNYASNPRNKVRSLILWTDTYSIVKFFNLFKCVEITWDNVHYTFVVTYSPNSISLINNPMLDTNRPRLQTSEASAYFEKKKNAQQNHRYRNKKKYNPVPPVPLMTPLPASEVVHTVKSKNKPPSIDLTENWADM